MGSGLVRNDGTGLESSLGFYIQIRPEPEGTVPEKRGLLYRLSNLVTFFDVIASKAWQSHREKLYYYGNEDILFMRLPRFARNDTFNLSIFNKSVT